MPQQSARIRRWILEDDWLEGIVALQGERFYNDVSAVGRQRVEVP
ncbi:hypothetical protein [Sphaerisporangium aureirubrum]|uniref:Uncharacterized protein n=1 Tax=Sphaerisporangium aureirubrum TaxID=1544736 RepID=A0ABW1NSI0_9ACTN